MNSSKRNQDNIRVINNTVFVDRKKGTHISRRLIDQLLLLSYSSWKF